ncbi:hypothetical protein GSI_08092 [Ganoderma sinense ZZ0214-1]|uniref:Uncharacterized protein n=1 Tax=Ganoderma sinense ZZ0214-1 TaxID=1077348 RepID=A0A2G8S7X9_9APHY|nr:hypothetical protein GSI_08092 [Ganoderma sinense ZZ0214-1]
MSDARALLRAKRQEVRINHPLATYTSSGQLRCIACEANVKHASSWEGHIGSKAHRTSAARLREERAKAAQREEEELESLKRKAMEIDEAEEDEVDEDVHMSGSDTKKRRIESEEPSTPIPTSTQAGRAKRAALPANFFSDPSMAPPPREDEDEDDEQGETGQTATVAQGVAAGPTDGLDLEWQQFQQSVINAPDYQETYDRATVMAEPVLAAEVPQGFPSAGQDGNVAEEPEELDEEAQRRKKEQEERELIMDRLMEEEQAQEEADARVSVMRNKFEALKKKREAARAAKKGKSS